MKRVIALCLVVLTVAVLFTGCGTVKSKDQYVREASEGMLLRNVQYTGKSSYTSNGERIDTRIECVAQENFHENLAYNYAMEIVNRTRGHYICFMFENGRAFVNFGKEAWYAFSGDLLDVVNLQSVLSNKSKAFVDEICALVYSTEWNSVSKGTVSNSKYDSCEVMTGAFNSELTAEYAKGDIARFYIKMSPTESDVSSCDFEWISNPGTDLFTGHGINFSAVASWSQLQSLVVVNCPSIDVASLLGYDDSPAEE